MPDVRPNRQLNCRLVELLGRGGSPDPTGVLSTRVFGNRPTFPAWTIRVEVTDSARKRVDMGSVKLSSAFGRARPGRRARLRIGEALLLRALEGSLLHEDTLSLVALSGATESNDDCA